MDYKWDPSLETGNYIIDFQHKELFKRMEQLVNAINRNRGKEEVAQAIAFIEEYAAQHFIAEEKMQEVNSYPDYDSHRLQHQEILKEIMAFKSELQMDGPTTELAVKSMWALGSWISKHVDVLDRKFADYLREKSKELDPIKIERIL